MDQCVIGSNAGDSLMLYIRKFSHALIASSYLIILAALAACEPPGPIYQAHHNLTPPASDMGRLCAAQCSNTKQQCAQNATLTKTLLTERCEDDARVTARRKYRDYVHKKRLKGAKVRQSEGSFYNAYHCKKKGSGQAAICSESYHQCYTTCGGQVVAQSLCVANCNTPTRRTQPPVALISPPANSNTVAAPVQTGSIRR